MRLPNMTAPCKDCPFRKDTLEGWLGAERISSILKQSSFTCHKTNKQLQCAGHMLIKGEANEFVATAKAYDIELELKGRELIFDTEQECINHHKI